VAVASLELSLTRRRGHLAGVIEQARFLASPVTGQSDEDIAFANTRLTVAVDRPVPGKPRRLPPTRSPARMAPLGCGHRGGRRLRMHRAAHAVPQSTDGGQLPAGSNA
jgi:hypothetical protein